MSALPAVATDVLALDLAACKAEFLALCDEWNALYRNPETRDGEAQGTVATRLRACGALIEQLERKLVPDPIPGYNEAGCAR